MRKPFAAALAVALLAAVWVLGREAGRPAGEVRGVAGGGPSLGGQPPGAVAGGEPAPITGVTLVPLSPDRQTVLRARVESAYVEADPEAFSYRWTVNGEEVGDTGPLLQLASFRPGDQVMVEVFRADGSEGAVGRSRPVEIVNNPPAVTAIRLVPPDPEAGQAIRAEVEGADGDGDPIDYAYEWLVNEAPVEGADGPVLDGRFVRSADRVAVVVTPSDPFSEGSPEASPTLAVVNHPPEITSVPPAGAQGGRYIYQVEAGDADGDPIRFQLVAGPPGMELDPESGRVEWVPRPIPGDQARVVLEAEDGKGGKSTQQFVIHTE